VVFLKIQDFARRSATEQARLRAQLQAVVAVTAAEIRPPGRVMLDSADGAAIVVLDDPRAALRLAERALTATAAGCRCPPVLNHGALQLAGRKGGEA
jgi:xanthine/CO dehydrogenase XdhC/CoxF family maturation factor